MPMMGTVTVPAITKPAVLAAADAASGGKVSERIAELARSRATYQAIADTVATEYGVEVSRETVRRWLVADGLVAAETSA